MRVILNAFGLFFPLLGIFLIFLPPFWSLHVSSWPHDGTLSDVREAAVSLLLLTVRMEGIKTGRLKTGGFWPTDIKESIQDCRQRGAQGQAKDTTINSAGPPRSYFLNLVCWVLSFCLEWILVSFNYLRLVEPLKDKNIVFELWIILKRSYS